MLKRTRWVVLIVAAGLISLPLEAQQKEEERLRICAETLREMIGMSDGISQEMWDKAECVLVIPNAKKGAFIVGGSYGRGALSCRTGPEYHGPWSAPSMYRLIGGNIGLQIGGQETDYVLLVMNKSGANAVLGAKVKLGADASVAAGPLGRTGAAQTTGNMEAQILAWSRAKGVFAGISLEGANLQSDPAANQEIYGRKYSARAIVREGRVRATPGGQEFISVLQQHSPKNSGK